jgi:transcriptional regulator with XRE-family HTH domain
METTPSVQLGQKIRKLRREKSWRQIDLAEHSGVHEVHISDLERGAREICLNNLVALARALGVSVSDLVSGIDE